MGCLCARGRDKVQAEKPTQQPAPPTRTNSTISETRKEVSSQAEIAQLILTKVRVLEAPILERYRTHKKIRGGKGLDVYLARSVSTGQACSIKIYDKSVFPDTAQTRKIFEDHTSLLCRADHPNILRIYEIVEDNKSFGVVAEVITDSNLMSAVAEVEVMTEALAAALIKQVLQAVAYAHSISLVHGSLSFADIALKEKPARNNFSIKVSGFGDLLIVGKETKALENAVFLAPEATLGNAEAKSDVWSCGVILYMLLSGESPFISTKYTCTVKKGKRAHALLTDAKWQEVSPHAVSLLRRMLEWDPKQRFSAAQCLLSPWFKDESKRSPHSEKALCCSLRNLIHAQACSMLKEAVKHFIVTRIATATDIGELVQSFREIDTDGSGSISLEELRSALKKVMPEDQAKVEAKRIMRIADINKSGSLDYTEFLLSAYNEKQLLSDKNLASAFNSFDQDKSKKITIQELKSAFCIEHSAESERLWDVLLSAADTSGDGEIDFAEFSELMRRGASY